MPGAKLAPGTGQQKWPWPSPARPADSVDEFSASASGDDINGPGGVEGTGGDEDYEMLEIREERWATLSTGRASDPLPGAGPGPALKGPGSGQNFDGLAQPSWGQGPAHLAWPDPA